jgi:hypothetical protein
MAVLERERSRTASSDTYEFPDKAALDRATSGEALKPLVAEFDRCWPDVARTREILVLAEEFGTG